MSHASLSKIAVRAGGPRNRPAMLMLAQRKCALAIRLAEFSGPLEKDDSPVQRRIH